MAEEEEPQDVAPKKKSKLPLLIGVVLMLAGGGGAFFATYSGMLLGHETAQDGPVAGALPDIAFVPIEPILVSLAPGSSAKHLRFTAQLEVEKAHESEVAMLLPRVLDVLNGYLRAIEVQELEDPSALVRLRAQMLRRIQIITGEGRVRDFLITEFVLN